MNIETFTDESRISTAIPVDNDQRPNVVWTGSNAPTPAALPDSDVSMVSVSSLLQEDAPIAPHRALRNSKIIEHMVTTAIIQLATQPTMIRRQQYAAAAYRDMASQRNIAQ